MCPDPGRMERMWVVVSSFCIIDPILDAVDNPHTQEVRMGTEKDPKISRKL